MNMYAQLSKILNPSDTPKEAVQEPIEPSITFRHVEPTPDRRKHKTATGMDEIISDFVNGELSGIPGCYATKTGQMHELSIDGRMVALRYPTTTGGFTILMNPEAPDDVLAMVRAAAQKNGMK